MNKDYSEEHENEKLEMYLLLEAIYRKYGYDFRNYSRASLNRRIKHRMSISGFGTISEMIHKAIYDRTFFETFLADLSITVTDMFRDPTFFISLRKEIFPMLKELHHIKIWVAGCSTGEEVYSLSILLKEEGLYDKSTIYATDFNDSALKKAKEGIYNINLIKKYTSNYQIAGGIESFSDYFIAKYDSAIMDQSLKKNIIFSSHNLVTDGMFGEMDMVICRNVLIYFNRDLQNNVFKLFTESLCEGGFLCLGTKETVRLSKYSHDYDDIVKGEKIYKKNSKPRLDITHINSNSNIEPVSTGFINKSATIISEAKTKLEELQRLIQSINPGN
ncbi:MAG: protein-glutamate O-methyltransferase CheR [Nitrospirae bacterium]|nr:protein-glutamate O-methyltransferase CheR [Nitrospirota bacterium]